jgi:hypothetical protein
MVKNGEGFQSGASEKYQVSGNKYQEFRAGNWYLEVGNLGT